MNPLTYLLSPVSWVETMAKEQSIKREGAILRRKYYMQIANLKPPTMTYKDPKPIIVGEGAESETELSDESLNCGQQSI